MGNPTSLGIKGGADLIGRIKALDQDLALTKVVALSVQLRGKSGVLRLANADNKARDVSFERKSWWQFGARSESNKIRTAEALKALVGQANLDTKQLDRYLADRGGRAGTRQLAQVLDQMVKQKLSANDTDISGAEAELPSRDLLRGDGEYFQDGAAPVTEIIADQDVGALNPIAVEKKPSDVDRAEDLEVGLSQPGEGGVQPSSDAEPLQLPQRQVQPGSDPALDIAVSQAPKAPNSSVVQNPQPSDVNRAKALARPERTPKERLTIALARGWYDDAAALMNARRPREMPSVWARELVAEHYAGKALTTRLVEFARKAFDKKYDPISVADQWLPGEKSPPSFGKRAEATAEFLLAAYNIPNAAQKDIDDTQVKNLVDALRLWQARVGLTETDRLAKELVRQIGLQLPDSVNTEALASRLSPISDNDVFNVESFRKDDGTIFTEDYQMVELTQQQLEDKWANIAKNKIQRVGNGFATIDDFSGAISESRARQVKLVERIQRETGAALTASYVNGVGLKAVENSYVVDPRGDLRNARMHNCVIFGQTRRVDFSNADLTGSDISLVLIFEENGKTQMMNSANFKNTCLDDANLHIGYHNLKNFVKRLNDEGRREIFHHVMNREADGTPLGPLGTILSIGDSYASIKLKLMHSALEACASLDLVGELSKTWVDTLTKDPIYLADPEIKQLAGPLLDRVDQ